MDFYILRVINVGRCEPNYIYIVSEKQPIYRGVKGYKLWDFKDRKIVLRRIVTFDESSIMKTSNSQQVESGQTKGISQRVESDASSPSSDSIVSFGVPTIVTQLERHVQEEEDTDDVIEGPEPEGQVQDSIAAHKPKRNIRKPARF